MEVDRGAVEIDDAQETYEAIVIALMLCSPICVHQLLNSKDDVLICLWNVTANSWKI